MARSHAYEKFYYKLIALLRTTSTPYTSVVSWKYQPCVPWYFQGCSSCFYMNAHALCVD